MDLSSQFKSHATAFRGMCWLVWTSHVVNHDGMTILMGWISHHDWQHGCFNKKASQPTGDCYVIRSPTREQCSGDCLVTDSNSWRPCRLITKLKRKKKSERRSDTVWHKRYGMICNLPLFVNPPRQPKSSHASATITKREREATNRHHED